VVVRVGAGHLEIVLQESIRLLWVRVIRILARVLRSVDVLVLTGVVVLTWREKLYSLRATLAELEALLSP